MTDSDSELRELMAEVPDEFLLRIAFNGLSMATEMRFDPSKRVTNRLCCLVAPRWIILNTIRRIGYSEKRFGTVEQLTHIATHRRVSTHQPVAPEFVYLTALRLRLLGRCKIHLAL